MQILTESTIQDPNKFAIEAGRKEEVDKKLRKLKAKAESFGYDFQYDFSLPYLFEVKVYEYNTTHIVERYNVEAVDVTIRSGYIKKGNYIVLALIEHLGEKNLVTPISTNEVKTEWYTIPGNCEHCGVTRPRVKTFIVQNTDTNEEVQVGRTCLKDYTGISPEGIVLPFALLSMLQLHDLSSNDSEGLSALHGLPRALDPEYVIGLAVMQIKKRGAYIKKDDPGSTFDGILDMLSKETQLTEDAKAQVELIKEFVLSYTGIDSFIQNADAILKSGVCKPNHIGRLAYLPIAVMKEKEAQQKALDRKNATTADANNSKYQGVIGSKLAVAVTDAKYITSWETAYGRTFLYKFYDAEGNVYVWFASGSSDAFEASKTIESIVGTVKGHEERDGVKQTILTRVKFKFVV